MNMAIDEALLEGLTVPAVRFYRWQFPCSLVWIFWSICRCRELSKRARFSPALDRRRNCFSRRRPHLFDCDSGERSRSSLNHRSSIYEKIHRALCDALLASGLNPVVAGVGDPGSCSATKASRAGISDAGYNCFANPVRADIMIDGRKIAGAAQRRTRRGLLQQGSIQGIDIGNGLAERFAQALSANCSERQDR